MVYGFVRMTVDNFHFQWPDVYWFCAIQRKNGGLRKNVHINFRNCFLIPVQPVQTCFRWKNHCYATKNFVIFYNNFFILFNPKAELLQIFVTVLLCPSAFPAVFILSGTFYVCLYNNSRKRQPGLPHPPVSPEPPLYCVLSPVSYMSGNPHSF